MDFIEEISKIINIEETYIELFLKTLFYTIIIIIIEKLGSKLLKKTKDNKKEYEYTRTWKLIIKIIYIIIIMIFWGGYVKSFITLISVLSAAFTIALRDLIFNFFCGLYIKMVKPLEIEDRIEINNYRGDVVNINMMNFEILEVTSNDLTGQSTGIIISLPNSIIFQYPLKNYNKAFKYIWDEILVKVPLDCDLSKAKSTLYKIVNSNEVIKNIPPKLKKQINNVSNKYRIYYNKYDPIIYTKIVDNYIELQIRYLVHPKKARFVESTLWNYILQAYKNNEIELYKND